MPIKLSYLLEDTASLPIYVAQAALRSASVIDGREPLEEVESLSRAVLRAACWADVVSAHSASVPRSSLAFWPRLSKCGGSNMIKQTKPYLFPSRHISSHGFLNASTQDWDMVENKSTKNLQCKIKRQTVGKKMHLEPSRTKIQARHLRL